jgi:hypothetical protein
MSEIAVLLQQKAGLSPEKSAEVEQIVVSHLMERVPPQFQGIVTSVLGPGTPAVEGQPAESGGLGSILGAVSGLFGSKG